MFKINTIKKFFLFFCFFLNTKISLKNSFSNKFQSKLFKNKIYEPRVYAIMFDNKIILIGNLSKAKNLNKILTLSKEYKKKTLNFLRFQNQLPNKNTEKTVKKELYKKNLNYKNFFFYTNGTTIWIIGYAKNFYEKEKIIEALKNLKFKRKINDFFCCLKFKSNNSKGFIFRHKI